MPIIDHFFTLNSPKPTTKRLYGHSGPVVGVMLLIIRITVQVIAEKVMLILKRR